MEDNKVTVECKIGPIELDAAQLVDGDMNERTQELQRYLTPGKRLISHGLSDKSEGFGIYCKKYKALQIAGLARWKEIEWIDSSTSLINNDDITHRGWGVLGKTELLNYPGPYCDMALELDIISPNENPTFLMDYVKGAFSQLLVGYDEDAKEYLVQDPFNVFSDQVWTDPVSYRISSPVVSASSGILYLQGIKSSGSYGALFSRLKQALPSKFTLETGIDLAVTYTPATTSAIYLSTIITTKESWNSFFSEDLSYSKFTDAIVISFGITYTGGSKKFAVYMYQFDESGNETNLITPYYISEGEYALKVDLKDDGNIDIYVNNVKKYSGSSGLSTVNEGLYAGYALDISDTATPSATYWMKATYMNISIDRTFPQQVMLPPYSRTPETPTTYRKTMWGDLPVFENPPTGVPFQTSPEDYDKAVPRAWSNDNDDGELRRIFNSEEVIDLGENKKIVYNNLVDVNIATATSKLGTTSKFGVYGASIASSPENVDLETGKTRSLKIFTEGSVSGEGYRLYSNGGAASPGKQYLTRLRFTGESGTVIVTLSFRNSGGSGIGSFYSSNITLDGSIQEVIVTGTAPENTVYVDAFLATTGTIQEIEYNLLEEIILEGNSIPDYDYMDPDTGDLVKEVRSRSNEFYLENGIIKIEPTNDSVKLYYFESLLTDNQHDVRTNLTGIGGYSNQSGKFVLERDINIFKTGGGSAKLRSTYDGSANVCIYLGGPSNKFPVIGGEEYYFTMIQVMVKAAADKNLQLSIRWYDSEGDPLTENNGWEHISIGTAKNLKWLEYEQIKIQAPEEAAYCYFQIDGYLLNNELLYYDSCQFGKWTLKEEIPIGNNEPIREIQIKEINREIITIGINRTDWTIRRGDPVVNVEHPYDDLGISLVTCYQHDGTLTTNPKAGDNITMNTQHYLLKWEAGPNMMGTYKWAHSVLGNDGKIYGIPDRAQDILIVDPATGTAIRDTMGVNIQETTTNNRWLGGVLGNDGKIYGIPYDATSILIIDPEKGTATTSTMGASLTGAAKWYGGVLGNDGKIYGIPYDATDILIIDPAAGTATRSAMGATLTGSAKWAGGAKGYAGRIYAAPNNATDVLIIDPGAGTASRSNLSLDLSGNYKYIGAVRAPSTGDIYCIPNNATKVLIIVNGPNIGTFMSGSALTGNDKWANGAVGSDGKIYAFPSSAEDILIINPAGTPSATRSNMGCTNLVEVYKWFSGCPGSDGKIYGIPEDVDDFLLINPTGGTATRDKLNFGSCDDPLNPQQKRLMIVQTSPTTIKSDKIPATAYTGLGIYDKDEAPNDPSGYITLAGCFVNRGRQKMKLL